MDSLRVFLRDMRSVYKVFVDNHSQDIRKYIKMDFKDVEWEEGVASGVVWIHLILEHENIQFL